MESSEVQPKSFDGKVAVVTGAAGGIGLALTEALSAAGAKIVMADIEAATLAESAERLTTSGAEVATFEVDVSDADAVESLAAFAVDTFGALHVACNNAGVSGGGLAWEVDTATWDWILGVNLFGVIHGVRSFVPRIIESGGGHVLNTASMAGLTSPPGMSPYNVSKHGVVTLSEGLYQELQLTHPEVGVSVLCPGWVRTRIHEADRNKPGGPEQIDPDGDPSMLGSMREMVEGLINAGLDPAEVAGLALDAMQNDQFYVLTHDGWNQMVENRLQRVVAGENPQIALPIDT